MSSSNSQGLGLLAPRSVVSGRYVVKSLISKSKSSEVYLVEDCLLDRQEVALKLFDPVVRRDQRAFTVLQQELLVNRSLRHPNILQLYDANFGESAYDFITMEYVDGESLLTHVIDSRDTALSLEEALYVFVELAAGISYAHQLGIVHRDISFEQALISREGGIRLRGCGRPLLIGRRIFPGDQSELWLQSPEEVEHGHVTEKSNQYSLGLLFLGLLAGPEAIRASQRTLIADPRSMTAMPQWLAELIQMCTHVNPEQRFESVEQALLFVEAQVDIDAIEHIARERISRSFRERRRVARRKRPSGVRPQRRTGRFQAFPREFKER